MEINKNKNGTTLEVALTGRLDTLTSNDLGESLGQETDFTDLVFDFTNLEYISSSGLRQLFAYQRKLGGKEHVVVRNANQVVKEIFRVTGFDRQITVE